MGRISTTSASLALLGALALSACGGADDDSASTADFSEPAATLAPSGIDAPASAESARASADGELTAAPAGNSTGSTAGSNAPSAPLGLDAYGRAIAVEAGIVIGTPNIRTAVDETLDIVAANQGSVYSADVNIGAEYEDGSIDGSGRIVVKVPPENLDRLIAALDGTAGVLLARTQSSDDVTDQLVDLDIRIGVERATIAQFEALLAEATAFDDIVTIQQTLSQHTIALEQLLANQRNVNQRVDLSTLTIDVRYVAPDAAGIEPVADGNDSVADALRSGWEAFAGVVMVGVLALAIALPFLLAGLVVVGIVWLIGRRSSAGRARGHAEQRSATLAAPVAGAAPTVSAPTDEELVGSSREG